MQIAWMTARCSSWTWAVSDDGTTTPTSHRAASARPFSPVTKTVTSPRAFAAASAFRTLGLRPDVVSAKATSPGLPSASTWREKTDSKS